MVSEPVANRQFPAASCSVPTVPTAILHPDRYLTVLETEGLRLADAAAGSLEAPVPSCPGWRVADLVAHVGVVHRHKERIVHGLWRDNPGIEGLEPPEGDAELLSWYIEGLDLLADTLRCADPDAPAWSWHEPDQTTGFWFRRMAHETTVHRVDAELGAGLDRSGVDAELAVDGLDEVLGPVMAAYTADARWAFRPDGRVLEMETSVRHAVRRLHLGTGSHGTGWTYSAGQNGEPTTRVSGRACDLYLWAWGRSGEDVLAVTGDPSLVAVVRSVVAEVTG
jgi:uncharacterized protein (TIGR03083 family)